MAKLLRIKGKRGRQGERQVRGKVTEEEKKSIETE